MDTVKVNPPMPDNPKCPQCGTPLPTGALAGLCPACLLKLGAATDTITNVTIDATGAISDSRPIVNTGSGGVLTINSLTITPVAQYISTLDSGSGTFKLGGNVTFTAATTGQGTISGALDLGGATRTLNVGLGTGPIYDLGISAAVANGALTKIGTGRLYLSGVSTYTGTTLVQTCLLYTSPSPRDRTRSRMPSSA